MELRARGWSISAAAREVGASRTSGMNWSRGYKTYRSGQVAGFVPALDRLAVREISARYLSQDERIEIADLRRAGMSVRGIAEQVGRSPSTISRELRRNGRKDGYRPFDAHRRAVARRARHHRRRLETNLVLRQLVHELLMQRWSPQQIARHLRARYADEPGMRLCHESIYQAIYQPGFRLVRPPKVAVPVHRSPLRTGRDHRRAHQRPAQRRPRFAQPMRSIRQRPFPPTDRTESGHWEGDVIVGKDQGSSIGTLVERKTRMIRLLHLPQRDSQTLHDALARRLGDLPPWLLRSITWDQGTEMARHNDISATLSIPIFFCDAHAPWQRGSNENANGLLRQYFPKGTDLSIHTPEHLLAVEDEINKRPRMILDDHAPAELFGELLASPKQPLLRR
jgi:IS30 family transposase